MTVRPTKTHLDLVPASFRNRLRVRTRHRVWPAVWGVALVACTAAVLWQREGLHAARAEAEGLRRRVAPLRAVESRTRALRRELGEVARRNELVQSLERHRPPVRLVGAVSRSAAPLAKDLSVEELRLEQQAVERTAAAKKPGLRPRADADAGAAAGTDAGAVRHEVTIIGSARDDVAVTRFVHSLRESQMFHTVQLRSTRPVVSSGGLQRKYEVTCAY
jgi:hypothetical protein